LLNNQWVIEEIREEIKSLLEANENGNTIYQSQWDTAKAVRNIYSHDCIYIKKTEDLK
jgi:hypothetical protein